MMNKHIKNLCEYMYQSRDYTHYNNKTVVILGANGLIGGMLANFFYYLQCHGIKVKLILYSRSSLENASSVKNIVDGKAITYISCDLLSGFELSQEVSNIDYCYYCAGYSTPTKFINQPMSTLGINTTGLDNVLRAVFLNNKNAKVLFMSSAEVYSAKDNTSLHTEDDMLTVDLNNKRSFYSIGKIAGELIVRHYRSLHYKISAIRMTICYGPGVLDDDSRMISDITRKAMHDTEIRLMDAGTATRRFLHISDFCCMILNVIETCTEAVYNIGSEEESSVYDVAQIIAGEFNKPVIKGIDQVDTTVQAPRRVSMCLNKYVQEFGKVEGIRLVDGLKQFIKWQKNKNNENNA